MSAVLARVDHAVEAFIVEEGRRPNVLIVGPQAECELYALGIKPGAALRGLRVVPDDTEPDLSVAYQKQR